MTTYDDRLREKPTEAEYRDALDLLAGRASREERPDKHDCKVCGVDLRDCLNLQGCCEICAFQEVDAHSVVTR